MKTKIFRIYDIKLAMQNSRTSLQQEPNILRQSNGVLSTKGAELFSLEDLFAEDIEWIEANVFELIPEVTVDKFTFVQIRR